MLVSRRSLVFSALALALLAVPGAASSSPDAARAFIDDIGKEAFSILQSSDPPMQKEKRLEDVFLRGFDLQAIGRFVLGRFWNTATPQQRQEYLQAFTDFVTRSYARRLRDESVSEFSITGIRDLGQGDYLVQTIITRPNQPQLNYEWRVRQSDGGIKIVDIIIEGVSLLVTQRSDFTSLARQEGIDGLIRTLRQKAAQ